MNIDGSEPPSTIEKITIPVKVELKQSASLNKLDDNTQLTNPLEIILSGRNAFLYTTKALSNLSPETKKALQGPVSTKEDTRSSYKLDLRVGFNTELEKEVSLESNGKGLLELVKNKTGIRTTLINLTDELSFLMKAKAFEDPKILRNRDSEEIIELHRKDPSTDT